MVRRMEIRHGEMKTIEQATDYHDMTEQATNL
ncbi:hypothetical protein GGR45_003439 [Sphingomonas zeae]|nr:hypothetical protein [Sphingomonas zeae]